MVSTRARGALVLLIAACGGLSVALEVNKTAPPKIVAPTRRLPGVEASGAVRLPNGWALRPVGVQTALGDFPVNLALHPSGRYLAALHAGYGEHEIQIVQLDGRRPRVRCRVPLEQTFYGLCFSPDGNALYASGAELEVVHSFAFRDGLLANHREIPVAPAKDTFIPGGIALDTTGQTLYAAGTWGDAVVGVAIAEPAKRTLLDLPKKSRPYTVLPEPGGNRIFVSLWGAAGVAVLDRGLTKILATWPTEKHPTEMVLAPDGKTLFVACANSTKVSVLDVAHDGKPLETLRCSLYPDAPNGNTPNSLTLTPDGQLLFVANADANNLAVFNVAEPGSAKSLGFIPVGWYPTSVRYNPLDRRLYVANGKGLTSRANPHGPHPYQRRDLSPIYQYIGSLMQGSLSAIDLPTPDQQAEYTQRAYTCSPLRPGNTVVGTQPVDSPIPARVGAPGPIQHCIYIIKENRTYDQVFGDLKEGNGDPNLCLFGADITPNHHRIAQQFTLFDNFYVEGEVSADGHEWSMAAYATDFVEKAWPLNYRGSIKRKLADYPAEGNFDWIARPAGGYLWDRCLEAGVSFRSYGEWVREGEKPGDPARASVPALEGHFDPLFHGYDLDYPDQGRTDRFLAELARFEREGAMPRLQIVRLPNDHTYGTRVGKPTPRALVADNDLALGRLVEGVSKSKFWATTAIFVVEDDAQNGPDHVDAHRSVALVISPYTRRRHVDSTLYSTSSMLRTMELILGLQPMSQFDAAATPMTAAFQAKADLSGYSHVVPKVDRKEKNGVGAWGAQRSAEFDFAKEDMADDLLLNEVIWHSIKGAEVPMPAPVRSAYVVPKVRAEDER